MEKVGYSGILLEYINEQEPEQPILIEIRKPPVVVNETNYRYL